MDILTYMTAVAIFGGCVFGCGLFALNWAHRAGQLRDFDNGARTIFDDDEPAGVLTDRFPSGGEIGQRVGGDAVTSVR